MVGRTRARDRSRGTGGTAPFTPASISGLIADFDGDRGVTLNSTTVSTWANQAPGATVNLAQSTAAAQPLYVTDTVNGHAALEFDGVDDLLVATGTLAPKHVLAVAVYDAATFATFAGLATMGGTAETDVILIGNSLSNRWYDATITTVAHIDGAAVAEASMTLDPLTDWHTTSISYATGWSGTLRTGQDRTNATRFWDGKLARLLCYDRVLSDSERQRVERYLRSRYGTP